jgi:hypothetical protein
MSLAPTTTLKTWPVSVAALALCLPLACFAQVYKSVGPDGKTIYSDAPPQGGAKTEVRADIQSRAPASGSGTDVPKLPKGTWEFTRTFNAGNGSKPVTGAKCSDPVATMAFWNDAVTAIGCTNTPMVRKGNVYTHTGECTSPAGTRRSVSTLTVDSPNAYSLQESVSGAGRPTLNSTTTAKRLGDC